MNLFVLLSKKIIFPEIDISVENDNGYFDMYVKVFNDGNNEFIRSVYKFMIIHHCISNKVTNSPFRDVNVESVELNQQRHNKYNFLKRNMENVFFHYDDKDRFLEYFCKIQKHYFAFSRLLNIWKYKRAKVMVSDDLYLNPLDTNGKNIFVIVQNRKKYMFSIANLINMVNSALSNTCHFFASPLILKNPYNNIVFNKSNLYNLYFAIKKSTFIMPILFHYFFLVDFNISRFREQHEGVIRDISIENYVKNTDYNVLYNQVFNMLKEHKPRLAIHPDFPKEELVNIMRPYLRLYYVSLYSLDEYKKLNAFSELHKKLHKFYRYNPKFGRKIVQRVCNTNFKFVNKLTYNDRHLKYYKPVSTEEFMKTHEEYAEYDSDHSSDEERDPTLNLESNIASNNIYEHGELFRILLFQNSENPDLQQLNVSSEPIIADNETVYDADSDSDSDSDFEYIGRPYRGTMVNEEETEYQEILRNMMLADDNQEPVTQLNNTDIVYSEESETETETDEIVIESDSDTDMDISDTDE